MYCFGGTNSSPLSPGENLTELFAPTAVAAPGAALLSALHSSSSESEQKPDRRRRMGLGFDFGIGKR